MFVNVTNILSPWCLQKLAPEASEPSCHPFAAPLRCTLIIAKDFNSISEIPLYQLCRPVHHVSPLYLKSKKNQKDLGLQNSLKESRKRINYYFSLIKIVQSKCKQIPDGMLSTRYPYNIPNHSLQFHFFFLLPFFTML